MASIKENECDEQMDWKKWTSDFENSCEWNEESTECGSRFMKCKIQCDWIQAKEIKFDRMCERELSDLHHEKEWTVESDFAYDFVDSMNDSAKYEIRTNILMFGNKSVSCILSEDKRVNAMHFKDSSHFSTQMSSWIQCFFFLHSSQCEPRMENKPKKFSHFNRVLVHRRGITRCCNNSEQWMRVRREWKITPRKMHTEANNDRIHVQPNYSFIHCTWLTFNLKEKKKKWKCNTRTTVCHVTQLECKIAR